MENDIRRWIRLIESPDAGRRSIEGAIKLAAQDFLADWVDTPEREPEPRRGFYRGLAQLGFEDGNEEGIEEALISLMRQEAHRFLDSMPWKGNVLPVFRNITVEPGWERDPDAASNHFGGLGVYWSFDGMFNMKPYGNKRVYMIRSEVTADQVNWYIVILKHLTYTENEIRIRDNVRVPIIGLSVWDGEKDIPLNVDHLQGKLFSVGYKSDDWGD